MSTSITIENEGSGTFAVVWKATGKADVTITGLEWFQVQNEIAEYETAMFVPVTTEQTIRNPETGTLEPVSDQQYRAWHYLRSLGYPHTAARRMALVTFK